MAWYLPLWYHVGIKNYQTKLVTKCSHGGCGWRNTKWQIKILKFSMELWNEPPLILCSFCQNLLNHVLPSVLFSVCLKKSDISMFGKNTN